MHIDNHTWPKILATSLIVLLPIACSNDVEEFEQARAAKSPGVYVNLSAEIQQAITLPGSQTIVQLRKVQIDSGAESEQTLTIEDGIASDASTLADGEHRYHVQILYSSATITEPLLLAAASKTSNAKRVEFTATELNTTTAFDLNGDGTIDETEKNSLNFDFDNDTRSNLAEILEGGNPKNREPSFLSPVNVSMAEGFSKGDSFYTAIAISPGRDPDGEPLAIDYGILHAETDARLVDLISIDAFSGDLSVNPGQELRYYPQGDNTYAITLTATDSPGNIAVLPLTLAVTDIFNLNVQASIKALEFSWDVASDSSGVVADYYKLLEDLDGDNDFKEVLNNGLDETLIPFELTGTQHTYSMALHLTAVNENSQYKLEAYRRNPDPSFNDTLLNISTPLALKNALVNAQNLVAMIGYFKAISTGVRDDEFGGSVALSSDGRTLVVGARNESSPSTGVNGPQISDCKIKDSNGTTIKNPSPTNCELHAGAAYIFQKLENSWKQQAYIKASNTRSADKFGHSVALSADGSTLAVGAYGEDNGATGVNGEQVNDCYLLDNSPPGIPSTANCQRASGAVYIYQKLGNVWQQDTYIKPDNIDAVMLFGVSVSLNADGSTLAVGAARENGGAIGVGGNPINDCKVMNANGIYIDNPAPKNCRKSSGAVYVYNKLNNRWQPPTYIKATNTAENSRFGQSVVLSTDGNTLAVGALIESSGATGVNGGKLNDCYLLNNSPPGIPISTDCKPYSGAVYVYNKLNGVWQSNAYIKASNTGAGDEFGRSVALSADGRTLAVGANRENSGATGVDGEQSNDCYLTDNSPSPNPTNCLKLSGAVYVFHKQNNRWQQQSYIKASNTGAGSLFGTSVSLSGNGNRLAVGADHESNPDMGARQLNNSFAGSTNGANIFSGAVYIYQRINDVWHPQTYIKASNPDSINLFGSSVAISADASTLAVGAPEEGGGSTLVGVGVSESIDCRLDCLTNTGAVYLY